MSTQANSGSMNVVSGISRLPFGPITSMTYGNQLTRTLQYDQDYQLTTVMIPGNIQSLQYAYDASGNITSETDYDVPGRTQMFQYDALYRLTQAQGLYGTFNYTYDAVGNRLSQQLTGGANNFSETYTYAATSNQLQSVVRGAATRSLSYTPQGNVANDNQGNGNVLGFSYNNNNRLMQLANLGQPQANYALNDLGQRVMKTIPGAPSQTVVFHYALDGSLLAESDGSGNVLREHIYVDGQPVAVATGGQLYFVHADRLGTPQRITDANENIVWDTTYQPFGQPASLTALVTYNLRLPGQYADQESGLNYNYFRDYDPSVGRYIQSDLIGLNGGLNKYAYVGGNPIRWADRFGMAIGDFPPPPPGYDPSTWLKGQWPNGRYWVEDPDGTKYTLHREEFPNIGGTGINGTRTTMIRGSVLPIQGSHGPGKKNSRTTSRRSIRMEMPRRGCRGNHCQTHQFRLFPSTRFRFPNYHFRFLSYHSLKFRQY